MREVWLFTLFVTTNDAVRWEPPRPGANRDWPLPEALGAGPLDPRHVYVFEAGDLGRAGLRKFLADAMGMDPDAVNADADKLDMIRGTVAVVEGAALRERPGRFSPRPPANFVAHYQEAEHLVPAAPGWQGESVKGHIPPPEGKPARLRRPLALGLGVLLLLLAGALWALLALRG
ncbi:MAG: hypothetical protein D6801_08685 [Alphaproteobacteria bacterium]|nr:MAG: hypothetical protein D6801_08685 [Alphaproteobacteria bacterium]